MIINLRKLDYLLIVIIVILYVITAIIESYAGQTFMRFLSPILILIFVIVYLQTIRSLEQEFKRVKQLSKKEILESVSQVDDKLGQSISLDTEEYKEIKILQHVVKLVEENIIGEIRSRTEIQQSIHDVESTLLKELLRRKEFQQFVKRSEESIIGEIRSRSELQNTIQAVESTLLKELIKKNEFHQFIKITEDRIIRDLENKTEQVYNQIDGLIAISKALEEVRCPLPPFRGWAISPDITRILMKYIFDLQPELMMELGSGVSTIISGYCLKMNGKGKLISLEHEEQFYKDSLTNIRAHSLESYVDLIYAPLKPYELDAKKYSWYDLSKLTLDQPIELLLVDGPPGTIQKESRYPAYPLLKQYLNHNAILLIDDYIRQDEKEMVKQWLNDAALVNLNVINTEKGTCVLKFSGI